MALSFWSRRLVESFSSPTMHLVIDATPLLVRSAGIKNYLYYWSHALEQSAGSHRVSLFPFLNRPVQLRHDRSVAPWLPTLARLSWVRLINRSGFVGQTLYPTARIFHASNLVRNPPRRSLLTTTLHDLTWLLMPEHHTSGTILAEHRHLATVLRRAAGIICVSEHTRQDALEKLDLDPGRLHTIYSGVAPAFFEDAPPFPHAKPYVLFLGTLEPRKNLDRLLDAYLALPPGIRSEFDLLVAGPVGWKAQRALARIQQGLPGVHLLGYIPEARLPSLVRSAVLLAYPSLYEGFGFPVAQAMAAGTPVLTSNVSALPEVAGNAALLVDPLSTDEIRSALEKLLTSPSLCKRLSIAGRERAQLFTWERCAAASWRFFEGVAGS
jgi:alpha-1,3-rhamnosyl/mannosyltransferase